MKQLTIEQFIETYSPLPASLKASLFADETTGKMGAIQESHSLSSKQVGLLARVVGLTMLGVQPIKKFVSNIVSVVGLDEQKAREVAKDINEQIFQPVREELMQVHGVSPNGELALNGGDKQSDEAPAIGHEQEESAPPAQPETPKKGKDELLSHLNGEAPPPPKPETQEEQNQEGSVEKPAPAQPTETHKIDDGAENHRKELLERLKNAEEAGTNPTSIHPDNLPVEEEKKEEKKTNQTNGPTATTAAWNGKTIDLSKIPPRREVRKREEEAAATVNEREIKLKKGSDGYWYEV